MKNKADLREIAELNGLTYAESTSGSNGYPNGIKGIIIGFDNFKDADKLADEHNLTIEFFKKKTAGNFGKEPTTRRTNH